MRNCFQAVRYLSADDIADEADLLSAQHEIGAHRALRNVSMQLFWFRHLPKHDETSFEQFWTHFPRDFDRSDPQSWEHADTRLYLALLALLSDVLLMADSPATDHSDHGIAGLATIGFRSR